MNATRLLVSTAQLAAYTALIAATVLVVPLDGAAQAAGSRVAMIPAPDGVASAAALDIDDLVAQRKAAWAADLVDRHLI
jgi:hypothetical protein